MSEKNESRDWELECEACAGHGYVLNWRQVAERKTDMQEFKEECECCEGRGFTIAFEDIPGIAEYVKSCRPAPSAPGDAQDERKPLFWYRPRSDDGYEGPIHNDRIEEVRKQSGAWVPLYPGFATLPKPLSDLRYHGEFIRGWNQCLREVSASVAAPAAGDALPTIKGAAITGGYVVVTPAGWGEDKPQKVRDAILRLFPVNPAYTPKPETAFATQQGKGGEA